MRAAAYKDYGLAVKGPAFGAIAIKGRGHVGFVAASNKAGEVALLGGNQSDSVCIRRYTSAESKDLTYRFPTGHTPPAENRQNISGIKLMKSTS